MSEVIGCETLHQSLRVRISSPDRSVVEGINTFDWDAVIAVVEEEEEEEEGGGVSIEAH